MKQKLQKTIIGGGEVNGFTFSQVFKNQKGYVYKVENLGDIWYESFLKKEVPICIDFENRIYSELETKEIYPKSKDFGIWAWTSKSLNKSIERLTN
jgi:hypothetical protein